MSYSAFDSWQAFFAMGGYAFYVWLAVAATLIPLLALMLHTWWQRRQLLEDVSRRQARERRIRQSQQQHNNAIAPSAKPREKSL
ncbi:heme exporter protein CcmD [Serratia odorifera]|jgi:heme exporter protein D|uniref:Heme exporter protein D n=2 Tax=Serratia odorifera TaxID=618 RepID=D4E3G2_SEROD|nr:heme exporter protein CcmD [Serratia odorifera]EFE95510.1 heme exporter protein CcmD [Serratia odorifera DSM 4582]MBJ2066053.1 heme exporter protein CcmD [Serratia odorifera]PNK90320.1 heme exporter CcmD [Serratia odorifera]RII71240.1 heme exporter protein CcmD [Serratia odorifera]VDZ60051.1 Cytochrome c-type biogenesis protein CcmD [Serratia odorifera]